MAAFLNRKLFCFGALLLMSSLSYANSNHSIFTITFSIMSYVKWSNQNPNLCVVDDHTAQNELALIASSKKPNLNVINVSSNNISNLKCDAIFFSQNPPTQEQNIINNLKSPPALSFSSNNDDCEIGSVFCLYTTKTGKSLFKVNLDSLAKTKIHIDPRVLLLAQQQE